MTFTPNEPMTLSKIQRTKAMVEKRRKEGKVALSAQETIAYREMEPDGVCRISERLFSKSIRFDDINYHLVSDEDKRSIFHLYSQLLDSFDESVDVQISLINQQRNMKEYEQALKTPLKGDAFDEIRIENFERLKKALSQGDSNIEKTRYLTVTVEADNIKEARIKLAQVEKSIGNQLKLLNVKSTVLNGLERLKIFHRYFHPHSLKEKFMFNWDLPAKSGLSSKDFIAPSSFYFKPKDYFTMGNTYGAVSVFNIDATEINDEMLADMLNAGGSITVNLHIKPVNQAQAIKYARNMASNVGKMTVEEEKKAVAGGYSMEHIPEQLKEYKEAGREWIDNLTEDNERMFIVTFIVTQFAQKKKELDMAFAHVNSIAQKYNCALQRADFRQEAGLMSSLPIGINKIENERRVTTRGLAGLTPFTTQELFMEGRGCLDYGTNPLSGNPIRVSRKDLKNPNGVIVGDSGGGKSFTTKAEMINTFISTEDEIVVNDPEGEYKALIEKMSGQVIYLSANSKTYINPMDISMDYSEDENPLSLKTEFIITLCETMMDSKLGLDAKVKGYIGLCMKEIYQPYFANPIPENMPMLEDLYNALNKLGEKPGKEGALDMADAMYMFVEGQLNAFNHRTNVDINNRVVCYDTKELGAQLKKVSMLVVQDQVWNRVARNRRRGVFTWYYCDEAHLLLKEEQTAKYMAEMWKRFRKWGALPTAITQNVTDFYISREVSNIFGLSQFIIMHSLPKDDRDLVQKNLGLSPQQIAYITDAGEGKGLMRYGSVVIPFDNTVPKESKLYKLISTKPGEAA